VVIRSPRACTAQHLVTSVLLAVTVAVLNGCAGTHALVPRNTAVLGTGIAWFGPTPHAEVATLDRWRSSVGPPVVVTDRAVVSEADSLTLVSWNTALGAGDIARFASELRRRTGGAPLVMLLQEVYRGGPEVPRSLGVRAAFASRLRGLRGDGERDEIETAAASLGMNVYYVPSMRNGAPGTSDEDRGNAILSTLPLSDLSAVELPFERQRRVAVAATAHGRTTRGEPWRIRLVSAHLDNMVGARRLWIAGGELARARQARGLVELLDGEPVVVLGGDFNTWFGFSDQAYLETARAFPQTRMPDTRATFRRLLRLDHLFYRLPDDWHTDVRRAESAFGSDHFPLVATIRLR
jgi:endonuclease/exonuclease/phosphatase family metal-dependent hydrolase